MNTSSRKREPSQLRLRRAVDMLADSHSKSQSLFAHIRTHSLSTFLIIAYGFIAYIYSPQFLVLFLGIVTIVFSIEGEKQSRRSRENQYLEDCLREITNLLEEQLKSQKEKPDDGEQSVLPNA